MGIFPSIFPKTGFKTKSEVLKQVGAFIKKDKFGRAGSQVQKVGNQANKKGRAKFGSAFFTYGSLNAVVLVRSHSLFEFEARRGRCTHIRDAIKMQSVFLYIYTNSMPNVLELAQFINNSIDINKLDLSFPGAVQKNYELFFTCNCENIFTIGKFLTVFRGSIEKRMFKVLHELMTFLRGKMPACL